MGPIEGDFAVAISLYHAYDLLMQHGLLPFYNFIKGQYSAQHVVISKYLPCKDHKHEVTLSTIL